jgi:Dolichyl-phosphate-mannose-protein mannosyltransferase
MKSAVSAVVEGATPERPSVRRDWRSLAVLAAFFAVAALASGAYRDVPVIDDWTYAWSVEQLLYHGRFAMLDWSAVFPVGPAIWGAAWSLVFGFSFATLRLSTLVLAVVGCGALYLILRELDASPRVALLGALSVAANPVFFLLSSSFMTDVPFVALTLLALLCYVRAHRRSEVRLLWWGGLWACLSCLDRQIGVLTPVAALPLLIRRPIPGFSRAMAAGALAATWTAMGTGVLVFAQWIHPTGEMVKLVDRLSWLFLVPGATYLTYNLFVWSTVAFYALPALIALGVGRRHRQGRAVLLAMAVLAAVMLTVIGEIPIPLRPNNTWTMRELGGARQLVGGTWQVPSRPSLELLLRSLGLVASALAVVAVVRRGDPGRVDSSAARPLMSWGRRVITASIDAAESARTPLLVYLAGYLVLVNLLWFYNDRYVLILLPVLVALALAGRAVVRVAPVAWVATAVFAVVAVAGTRDALRFNQEVRDTWQALVDSGVPPSQIDAGYAWTGWMLYAHPENLSHGLTVKDVPWVTSKRRLPYLIGKERLDGYDVAREVEWNDDAMWPGPDRLYVLKRRPTDAADATSVARPAKSSSD